MSKVFYDHLLDLAEVEKKIKHFVKDPEEREEIYQLIDEIVHHRVMGCVLDKLPKDHHKEFLGEVEKRPHDEGLLEYLAHKIKDDIERFIKHEAQTLAHEFLSLLAEKTAPKPKKLKTN